MKKENSTYALNLEALSSCGLTYAAEMIRGRWKLHILWGIYKGANRYGMLKKAFPISEKMLTQQLKGLVEDGLLLRKDFNQVPPYVEYHLTIDGQSMMPILEDLCKWGYLKREKELQNDAALVQQS